MVNDNKTNCVQSSSIQTDLYYLSEDKTNLFSENNDFENLDDLFADAVDYSDSIFEEEAADFIGEEDYSESVALESDFSESTTWNYIIVRLKEDENTRKVIKKLSRIFKKNGTNFG